MYANDLPKPQEIRYWSFVDAENRAFLTKVRVLKDWYDRENKYRVVDVRPVKNILGDTGPGKLSIDIPWQMQKTLESAKRVMILGIFKGPDNFFRRNPPWE